MLLDHKVLIFTGVNAAQFTEGAYIMAENGIESNVTEVSKVREQQVQKGYMKLFYLISY